MYTRFGDFPEKANSNYFVCMLEKLSCMMSMLSKKMIHAMKPSSSFLPSGKQLFL